MSRLCACGCGRSLAAMRADAVFHSDACRKRALRAYRADKARTRRESRNGLGLRVYLQPHELAFTAGTGSVLPLTHRKFKDALARLAA